MSHYESHASRWKQRRTGKVRALVRAVLSCWLSYAVLAMSWEVSLEKGLVPSGVARFSVENRDILVKFALFAFGSNVVLAMSWE